MPLELSPAAQYWVNVALIWVGFGALAGLVARIVLPIERPAGPSGTLSVGIVGSALGLLGYSLIFTAQDRNPIGPIGFAAALVGTLVVLVVWQPIGAWCDRYERARDQKPDQDPPEES